MKHLLLREAPEYVLIRNAQVLHSTLKGVKIGAPGRLGVQWYPTEYTRKDRAGNVYLAQWLFDKRIKNPEHVDP